MKHVAILMANYAIECSCDARFGSIQEWGDHRAEEAWDEAVDALDRSHGDIYPIAVKSLDRRNPYREQETP